MTGSQKILAVLLAAAIVTPVIGFVTYVVMAFGV